MRFNEKRPMAMADQQHDHPVVSLAYFLISRAANEHRTVEQMKTPKWMMPKPHTNRNVLGHEAVRIREDR